MPSSPSAAELPELLASLRWNEAGLLPAIAQDWLDGAVLMVAWMNADALERTLASGEVHYWSRSRRELWHKGASSGQIQKLRGLRFDCDADVLLLSIGGSVVAPATPGPAAASTRQGRTRPLAVRPPCRHLWMPAASWRG